MNSGLQSTTREEMVISRMVAAQMNIPTSDNAVTSFDRRLIILVG